VTDQTVVVRVSLPLVLIICLGVACSSGAEAARAVVSPVDNTGIRGDSAGTSSTVEAIPRVDSEGPSDALEIETEMAFNGRPVPPVVASAEEASALFSEVERALRVESEDPLVYADLGHTEQLIIRQLMRNQEWIESFTEALPDDLRAVADLHITARRELSALHAGGGPPLEEIPAWAVVEPEPLDTLVEHYQRAGQATGIDWQILAGINLIETGMGRIDGLSSAGAQGPMQFLPSTWEEVSEGGDIDSPSDAIDGAARYLVQRGGLEDIRDGLYGYNNSDNYVNAVLAYAELLELDERALRGFYNWEVYVGTASGTLWLPVGYLAAETFPATEYVDENPWALTLG
jgi:hypothetical protein